MAQELTIIEDELDLTPEMSCLSDMRRRFVYAMLQLGGQPGCQTNAAIMAGYSAATASAQGSNLMRDKHVLAALRSEGDKRLRSGVVLGASVLMDIAANPTHKDQYKAACRLLDQAGLIIKTEHTVEVKHTVTEEAQVARIIQMAKQMGLDPKSLLGNAGYVIDAEFTEVVALPAPEYDEWTVGGPDGR